MLLVKLQFSTVPVLAKRIAPPQSEAELLVKLLFILPNSEEISANYGGNGTWWAVHTFDDYGVYEVNASYTRLDNVTVNNGTVTISKANSTIGAENKTVTYPSDIVLVTSGENCTGINKSSVVIRNLDGTVADANVNVDGFTITISGLGTGNYTVYYNNTVNSDWNGAVNITGITVLKANSSVSAEDVEVTYGDPIEVVVTSENATGVSYKVIGTDGIVKEGTINVNENINNLDLAAGEYTVNLTTMTNSNYTSGSYTSKITVKPANSAVSAEDVEVVYGESIEVVVTSENATGVSYKVIGTDGIVKEGTVNVGENIAGLDLAAGEYTVNLTTMTNSNYTSSSYTSKITVNVDSRGSVTEAVVSNNTAGNVTIDVTVVDAETGELVPNGSVEILINDTVIGTGEIEDGKAIIPVDIDEIGIYDIDVRFLGNENYTGSDELLSDVEIAGRDATITPEVTNNTVGDTSVAVHLSDTLTDEPISNATIIITLPDGTKILSQTDENGMLELPVDLPAGLNNITVEFAGDGIYNASTSQLTVDVVKRNATLTPTIENINGNATVTIEAVDSRTDNPITEGLIELNLPDGTKVTEPLNENGTAIFENIQVPKGISDINATLLENPVYNKADTNLTIDNPVIIIKIGTWKLIIPNGTDNNATIDDNVTDNTPVTPKVSNKYPNAKYSNNNRNSQYNKYNRNSEYGKYDAYNNYRNRYNRYNNYRTSSRPSGGNTIIIPPLTKEKYLILITLFSEYFDEDMSFSDFVAILKLNGIEIATVSNWDENGEMVLEFDNFDEVPDTIELHDNSNNVKDYSQNIDKNNAASSSGEIDGGDIEVETTSNYHSNGNANSNTGGSSNSNVNSNSNSNSVEEAVA